MTTLQEAKAIIQRLAVRHGYLDSDMMDTVGRWDPDIRARIDESWLGMETIAAQSIRTLARRIYGTSARFIFELLQNADDNKFRGAEKRGEEPFIRFKLYPKRIVIDCNEDGFTEGDLEAICAVGKSTKAGSGSGYIGNKGIGFKSVFMVASKVYIHSGNFSFQFRHRKNDPGLGMVRPEWRDATEQLPSSPMTRMVLSLHTDGDAADFEHLQTTIRQQFKDLQETCLLFLERLRLIEVIYYNEDDDFEEAVSFRKRKIETDHHQVSIERSEWSTPGAESNVVTQRYHITKQTATGLEIGDGRDTPASVEARESAKTAEVVLAFPLTTKSKPQLGQKQHIFAFLPVRRSEYFFLIHADFDTDAGRGDIVTTSRRNQGLKDWIAKTFVKAVLEFCEDERLCYEWPSFLPDLDEANSTSQFWLGVNEQVSTLLKATPCLRSRNRRHLRLISDIVVLSDSTCLGDGTPVLDDPEQDMYLSSKYGSKAALLRPYGLKRLTAAMFVDFLEADIARPNSRMHDDKTNDEWHTVVATALLKYVSTYPALLQRLKKLDLLLLQSGEWRSRSSGPVFFPETDGIEIPKSLEFNLLDASTMLNPSRKSLCEKLGVEYASTAEVRAAIFKWYLSSIHGSHFVKDFNTHLRYLFLTPEPSEHNGFAETWSNIIVIGSNNVTLSPHRQDIYLPGQTHPFSPQMLMSKIPTVLEQKVHYLKSIYIEDEPDITQPNRPSWREWLHEKIGIRRRLRLLNRAHDDLSDTSQYIIQHHPEKFLGLLKYLWPYESHNITGNQNLKLKFQELNVRQIVETDVDIHLCNCWLPLPTLRSQVDKYMEFKNYFPFLKVENLSELSEDTILTQWNFLHVYFGVGKVDNIDFFLAILRYINYSYKTMSISQNQKILDLYEVLGAQLTMAENIDEAVRKVRSHFKTVGIFCIETDKPEWELYSSTYWFGPQAADMKTASILQFLYSRTLGEVQLQRLESFFCQVLRKAIMQFDGVMKELKCQKDSTNPNPATIKKLYEYLHRSCPDTTDMAKQFASSAFIYAKQQDTWDWHTVSDCIWSSTTPIRGKATLEGEYEDLQDFFVETLGVKQLTMQLLYDELTEPQNEQDIKNVKGAIGALSSFLEMENSYFDPRPLLSSNIFPVSYCNGSVVLRSATTEFAIGDTDHLRHKFESKLNLLDFDLSEVRQLKPFFEWINITNRYLSKCIEEDTSVSDQSGRLILSGPRCLQFKAHPILRVAASFQCTRYRMDPTNLYRVLRGMQIKETDKISTSLWSRQNNQRYFVDEVVGYEHFDESNGLVIYVPRKKKAQEICFCSVLPRKFAEWLMRNPGTNALDNDVSDALVQILTVVFAASHLVMDELLYRQGIVEVSLENCDPVDTMDSEDEDQETSEIYQDNATSPFTDDMLSETLQDNHSETSGTYGETAVDTVVRQSNLSSYNRRDTPAAPVTSHQSPQTLIPSPRSNFRWATGNTPSTDSQSETARYKILLNHVVSSARRAAFPSQGSFNLTGLSNALFSSLRTGEEIQNFSGLDTYPRFYSTTQFERDKKVGAAGELYVFELLKKQDLSGWGRGNWQSRIRTYANIHAEYTDIEPWEASETSDLVYDDTQGQFTDLLIGCGYLEDEKWRGAHPRYYIEVKTTTGPRETPFYVSQNQYNLMESKHRRYNDLTEVYLILRVYWLANDRINMCAYFDPWQLKEDGMLLFTGQSYSVIPRPEPWA